MSDDLKIGLLIFLAVVGIPLNCVFLVLSSIQYYKAATRTLLVQIHRSIIDFLFLSIYTSSQIYLIIVRVWTAGTIMCKTVYFLRHFCFSLSSNLIVCIAIDRWISVQKITQVQKNQMPVRKMVMMLGCIWALSAVIAMPVLFIRTVVDVHDAKHCIFVWVTNETLNDYVTGRAPIHEHVFLFYDIFSKFWIPFILVLAIYCDVSLRLRRQLQTYKGMNLQTIPIPERKESGKRKE